MPRLSTLAIAFTLAFAGLLSSGCQSDGAKLIEHYETISELVAEHEDDCDAMKSALDEYDADHGEEIRSIWEKGKDMRGTTEEGERLSQLVIEVQVGVSSCGLTVPGFE